MRKVLVDDGLRVGIDGGVEHLLDLVGREGLALLAEVPLDLVHRQLPLPLRVQRLEGAPDLIHASRLKPVGESKKGNLQGSEKVQFQGCARSIGIGEITEPV